MLKFSSMLQKFKISMFLFLTYIHIAWISCNKVSYLHHTWLYGIMHSEIPEETYLLGFIRNRRCKDLRNFCESIEVFLRAIACALWRSRSDIIGVFCTLLCWEFLTNELSQSKIIKISLLNWIKHTVYEFKYQKREFYCALNGNKQNNVTWLKNSNHSI